MSRLRRLALTAALVLGSGAWRPGATHAEDAPPERPPAAAAAPTPPRTPEQAADAVRAAVAAQDAALLAGLAAMDTPDPWLVADELLRRAEPAAAEALAQAAPRADVEALPAYVAARRGQADDPARRTRLAESSAAFAARNHEGALAALGAEEPGTPEDVVGVRLAFGRGSALAALARWEAASAAFLAAAEAAERLGWLLRAGAAYQEAGVSAYRGSRLSAAQSALERRLAISERRADEAEVAATLASLGVIHYGLGDYALALSRGERGLAAQEALGNKAGAAKTLSNIGSVHQALGDYPKALASFERALATQEGLGDKAGAAATLGSLGSVYRAQADYVTALALYERALAAMEALGAKPGAARMLGNIGTVHANLGDHAKALAILERARAAKEALGERAGAAGTLANIGNVHEALGDYAKALSAYENALAAQVGLEDKAGAAITLGNIGILHTNLGDHAKALSILERALAAKEAVGNRVGAARTLGTLANVHQALGDHARALAMHERALVTLEALGDRAGAARTLGNIGLVQLALGDTAKAHATLERAWASQEALGDRSGAALTLGNLGTVEQARGETGKALTTYARALAAKEALGDKVGAAQTLGDIGALQHALGEHAQALAHARRAVVAISSVAQGLGAEEGAGAREPFARVYDVGAAAAAGVGDASELAFFLESGRAGALLEGLKARETLWSAEIPATLRAEELKERAAEALATRALRQALDGTDRSLVKARRVELDAATARVSSVIARIQREAKAGSSLVYPVAATLDEIRALLVEGDALVLYGLLGATEGRAFATTAPREAWALVITREAARIVRLASGETLETRIAALALDDAAVDPTQALAELARLVVTPLALPPSTKRVLISPSGALAAVPFATLLPDVTVVYAASGTTYGLLREEESLRGAGVLALGDPDYATKPDDPGVAVSRGAMRRLLPLPATRDEAQAVGTRTLLGAEATEAGLTAALATRPRWRAVHLACHGLVDPERPALTSLAITAEGDDDGFLTCLDLFRMKVPADLVVLSACETGKGRVLRSEGIVGLTRAFMFAGSPRVLCSLWKVDDEATSALMTKFYELWSPRAQPEDPERAKRAEGAGTPGLPAAEALRKAQEFVRSQPRWKHPYYWAAWVLWGLPS